jgi:hypothetical protein
MAWKLVAAAVLLCATGSQAANILHATAVNSKEHAQESVKQQHGAFSELVEKVTKVQQDPQVQRQEQEGGSGWMQRVLAQLIYGVIYYFIVVTKYVSIEDMPDQGQTPGRAKAVQMQNMNACAATFSSKQSAPNFFCSWCCTGPRAAHTFHSTGLLNYWLGLVLMSCFPCCTLWVTNSFSDLNLRLGGDKMNPFTGCFFACLFPCCLVAQDAQSLDYLTGQDVEICGVTRAKY